MENPIDKINEIKNNLTDVDGHVEAVKEKGNATMTKAKELGLGGGGVLLLGVLTQLLFPWWVSAIAAFWVGMWVADSAGKSYLYGFAAMFLMWSVYAGFQSSANGGLITDAFSNVFGGKLSGGQLIGATGLIGGLVGGFSAMTGTLLRQIFQKEAV
jgi:hypothetical protein